jgi:hypothetical protein
MPENALVKSPPPCIGGQRVISILKSLGIPYKKKCRTIMCRFGYSFWMENEAELEWILYDAMQKIKQLKVELHPDRENGDQEKFIRLNEKAQWLQDIFRRHGVGQVDRVEEIKAKETKEIQRQARYNSEHPKPRGRRRPYRKKNQKAHSLLWFLQHAAKS